jgi:hypothetical protein
LGFTVFNMALYTGAEPHHARSMPVIEQAGTPLVIFARQLPAVCALRVTCADRRVSC